MFLNTNISMTIAFIKFHQKPDRFPVVTAKRQADKIFGFITLL